MIEFHKLKPIGKMSIYLYTASGFCEVGLNVLAERLVVSAGERNVEATRAGTSLKQGLIDNPPIIYKFSGG